MPIPLCATLFPYTTLFRSLLFRVGAWHRAALGDPDPVGRTADRSRRGKSHSLLLLNHYTLQRCRFPNVWRRISESCRDCRSEEHTSELQSLRHLVCRLLLE